MGSEGPCSCNGSGLSHCTNCSGSGKCRTRRYCPVCDGTGQKVLGECRECRGAGYVQCVLCCPQPEVGQARRLCTTCAKLRTREATEQQERRQNQTRGFQKPE